MSEYNKRMSDGDSAALDKLLREYEARGKVAQA